MYVRWHTRFSKKKLKEKLGEDKVGEMFCLGHCYENSSFHYNGENYAGNNIDKIDQIIKGENITQQKYVSKSVVAHFLTLNIPSKS